MPARILKNVCVIWWLGATRHHIELPSAANGIRDSAQRHTVDEAVDETVRVFGLYELLNRWGIGEKVADRHAAMRCLRSGNAERSEACRDGVCSDHDERAVVVQRFAELAARVLPVELVLRRHGEPA